MTQAVRPFGIVLDGSRIFWTDEALSTIQSFDRVSGQMQTFVDSPLTDPRFIQLDPQNEKLYWGDGYVIRRANMRDGSGIEYWRNAGYLSQGQVAVDTGNETVYWTTWDGWMPNDNIGIFRTDLDQFDPVRLSTDAAWCVTLDQENRKLYWIGGGSIGGGSIRRANLDGTDVENIIPRASGYNDFLTIDPIGRKLYWGWENGKVLRSNLDGTEIEKSGFSVVDINRFYVVTAVDPSTDNVYWATTDGLWSSEPTARIFRAGFSGTEVEQIFVASPAAISGIALDLLDPNTIVASERDGEPEIPSDFSIHGNYPNPFNPATSITFDLPEAASVSVQVFDVTGRMVMQTPEETFSAGAGHVVRVNATAWNSGLYLYKVIAQARTSPRLVGVGTGRMMLVK
ncbi:MAG: T9SS type A sorting domain-containing protein [Rhodothermia bacterium]